MKVHFSGYAPTSPTIVAGTACRPDGEYGRTLLASSRRDSVTCKACLAALTPPFGTTRLTLVKSDDDLGATPLPTG